MSTRISVRNAAGKRVFFYHCIGYHKWSAIVRMLRPLGITPETFYISVNYGK